MTEQLGGNQIATGGTTAKRSRGRSTREGQARIGELAAKLFTENPAAFWSFSVELADAIEQHLQASARGRTRVPVFEGYMTEREREFKLRSLADITQRYQAAGTLEPDEARRALELGAALKEHAQPYKAVLLELVQRVIRLPFDSTKSEKITIAKGKPEHHVFTLARGVTLSLAWDGQLISIGLDPEEYQRRRQALSFVGIAADTQGDVAENHDAYLWTTLDGR